MNAIFSIILVISILILTITNPTSLFTAFSSASNKAIELSFKLLAIYVIWLGFTKIFENSPLTKKLQKKVSPLIRKIFKTNNEKAISTLSLNLTGNLLGISAITTITAIDSMSLLDKENNEHAKTLLFVISATSIQILPLSVMQLLLEYGSTNPSIIILPTLFTTILSTTIGIILTKVFK